MQVAKVCLLVALCAALGGCLSSRKAWESGASFLYAGNWKYADKVYSGIEYKDFQGIVLQSINVNVTPWPLTKMKKGYIESDWVAAGGTRKKLEIRIDDTKDAKGRPGFLVSLRVLLQKTREVYTPWKSDSEYHWENRGQDDDMMALILMKIDMAMDEYYAKTEKP